MLYTHIMVPWLAVLLLAAAPAAATPSFDEEVVELDLDLPTSQRALAIMRVTASYWFRNSSRQPWRGAIAYPIWVATWQPPPREVVLDGGRRRPVRCLTPSHCAATFEVHIAPGTRTAVRLRYLQTVRAVRGQPWAAVYLLTSGASWPRPIGRARLRVVVPAGSKVALSYPASTLIGQLTRRGSPRVMYEVDEQRFVPHEELRVAVGPERSPHTRSPRQRRAPRRRPGRAPD